MLAGLLYDNLVLPEPTRVTRTGQLSPTLSLRHKQTREAFHFAKTVAAGRVFTEAFVRDAVQELVSNQKYPLVLPETPGFVEKNLYCP